MASGPGPATHVALLRGVNVGGTGKLPMAALRAELRAAGFEGVATYVQSGNVVLAARPETAAGPETAGDAIAARVGEVIAAGFGLDVAVVVRSAAQLAAVAAANPFLGVEGATNAKLHVAFLQRPPAAADIAALDPHRAPPDVLAAAGSEVFAYCPNGLGRSKVFTGMERILKVPATVRNWNTVTALLAMCAGDPW